MIRPADEPGTSRITVKRYANGKVFAFAAGREEFAAIAEQALQASIGVEPVLDVQRFREGMARQGVPGEVIAEFLESIGFLDEAWLQDDWPR